MDWSDEAPVRIVGVDDHRDIEPLQISDSLQGRNIGPGMFPGFGMSAIGWPENADAAGWQHRRQALDQGLCPRHGDNAGRRPRSIG